MSKVVIDVWVPDLTFPGWMDRWFQLGKDFERAYPQYEVRVQGKDFWTFPQEVSRAAAAGTPPTLAELYFYMGQVARDLRHADGRPLFTSVEQAVDGRSEINGEPVVLGDLMKPFREYYTVGGDLMSMPSVCTTSLLYANTDLLDKAGVTELPETWTEVAAVCEQIARAKGAPENAITWSNHGTFYQQALATQGGLLVNNDNGRSGRATEAELASKEMLAWAEIWRELHRDGHYLHTGGIPDWAQTLRAFAEQDVAIRISSSNDVNYMVQAAKDNGFGIEVGLFPFSDQLPYVGNAIAGTSMWLTSGLDEATQDGALTFLQYMHNTRNAADRHKANSFAPVTHASFDLLEREGWFEQHPYHRVASDHVTRFPAKAVRPGGVPADAVPAQQGAVFGDFAGNQDVMTRAMGDVLRGADPITRFTQATEEAQALLDTYNAYALGDWPRDPDGPNSSHKVEYFTTLMAGRDYSAADLENVVKLNR
ncbi:extracellular solute-binding protein [Amycolatopsis magusensis]|uniref:extracellular solute-binding protein n=1 Tax=Amycolatopsis magusensis TaxID=882444 RepID=UPI003C305F33